MQDSPTNNKTYQRDLDEQQILEYKLSVIISRPAQREHWVQMSVAAHMYTKQNNNNHHALLVQFAKCFWSVQT